MTHIPIDPPRPPRPRAMAEHRMFWMDILRGAAILAVIAYHSVSIPESYGFTPNDTWRQLNETLQLFRMPLLVFLSGMLLTRSLAKPVQQYLGGKLRGILWPFLVWSTIYIAVSGREFMDPSDLQQVYTGGSHLWFLGFIFVYYLAAKPLEAFDPLLVAAAAFGVALLSPDGAKYSERVFYLMALFFLGAATSRHAGTTARMLRSDRVWWLAPIVAVAAMASVRFDLDFGPYWVAISLCGMLFFSAVALRLERTTLAGPLIWIGQRSIVFYVSHAIFMILIARIAGKAGVTSYAAPAVASIVISLAGGWFLALGMARWPAIAALFDAPIPKPTTRPQDAA
ncbi:acyltransferase [Paracoccus rhizosphaerae]|uniref:Acyltransferase n=1 Tax=Paracoccus rhizosphaerae TaxID=1133347 RepID=A0ABV6CL53_9RHOB|nr:acyltransferase [Paracoccus rhizosphaerae]